jgi:hypothetical protein
MTFHSILGDRPAAVPAAVEQPAFFPDLNLDQIVAAITAGRDEYDLKPFFHAPLADVATIAYRHEVMRDLEKPRLLQSVKRFAQAMCGTRSDLAQIEKLHDRLQKQSWFLDAVERYGDAIDALLADLKAADLRSRGFSAFRDHVAAYAGSEGFRSLVAEMHRIKADLATVTYCLLIREGSVTVRRCDAEPDYGAEVQATFAKFQQGAAGEHQFKFSDFVDMNHVEAHILSFVARLHPEIFSALDNFCARHADYVDPKIRSFDREAQFYVATLDHIEGFRRAGLHFCYPELSPVSKEILSEGGFDLALAAALVQETRPVITNDFHLEGSERIFVVSGPNQGGKTTFARTFGQLHYLACLGLPIAGTRAQLFLFDRLFTHFEKEEDIRNLRGKLQDDLVRLHDILEQATPRGIVIMNEIFTSTTLRDAVFLGREILTRLIELDVLGVCVTFLDELASLGEATVSVVSTVLPDNPAMRTFKIVRRQADGMAHALSIAEKHRLTYARLKERLGP